MISKIEKRLYLIPGFFFLLMIANGYGPFSNSNNYKTFLLYLSVGLLYIFVEWWFRPELDKQNINIVAPPWKWVLLLSVPIIGTAPGFFISGGGVNNNLEHELSIHIGYMLWLIYLVWLLRKEGEVEKFLYVVGGATIYIVLSAIIGVDITGVNNFIIDKSTFGNKNFYSNFLILWLPLLLMMALPLHLGRGQKIGWGGWNKENSYFSVVSVFAVIGLYEAQTRSAIVGLILASFLLGVYVLFLVLKRKYALRSIHYIFAVIFLTGLMMFFIYLFISQMDEQVITGNRFLNLMTWQGWSARLMAWQTAWSSILSAPWFGWGSGSSYNLIFEFVPDDFSLYVDNHSFEHVHNEWLEVAQEGGLFGWILYLVVIFILFYILVKAINSDEISDKDRKILIGGGLGVVAYLFHSTFSLATRMTINEFGLYTVIGIMLVVGRGQKNSLIKSIISIRLTLFVPIVIGGWLGYIGLSGNYYFEKLKRSPQIAEMSDQQIIEYIDSLSVDGLHWMAVKMIKQREIDYLVNVLDKIDNKFENYRDISSLRAIEYQLSSGVDMDINKFKHLIQRQLVLNKYHAPSLHWMARIAAWESDSELLKEQILSQLQSKLLSAKLIEIGGIGKVNVILFKKLDGVALKVSADKIEFFIGESIFKNWMTDLQQYNSQDEANKLLKLYADKVYISIDPSMEEWEMEKVQSMFVGLLAVIAGWSTVPIP